MNDEEFMNQKASKMTIKELEKAIIIKREDKGIFKQTNISWKDFATILLEYSIAQDLIGDIQVNENNSIIFNLHHANWNEIILSTKLYNKLKLKKELIR